MTQPSEATQATTDSLETSEYERAHRRVERKRKVHGDIVAYLAINAFLIGIWAVNGGGYFWPGWVLAGWGVLLALDVWNTFYRRPVTSADVEQELRRMNGARSAPRVTGTRRPWSDRSE